MKQIVINKLKSGDIFHSEGTEYLIQKTLHHNCYDKIKDIVIGLGLCGLHKGYVTVFNKDDIVEIEVKKVVLSDIEIGKKFRVIGGLTEFTKLKSYLSINNELYGVTNDYKVKEFPSYEEVESI